MTRQYGTGKTFTTAPEHYRRNYERGEKLRVVPAVIGHNTGATPGAAIFVGSAQLLAVITVEHARNLADQLTDVLDSLSNGGAA